MPGLLNKLRRLASPIKQAIVKSNRTQVEPGEQAANYYDDVYAASKEYRLHYLQSRYYFVWTVLVDRVRQFGSKGILEIGCGSGQFAEMLRSYVDAPYTGLDFSQTAIDLALEKEIANAEFVVDDARTCPIFETAQYDTVICTEVLEHIEDDLLVVSRVPVGTYCLFTVPDFPYTSHVRHFENCEQVEERYQRYLDNFDVYRLWRPEKPGSYYIFEGTRQ